MGKANKRTATVTAVTYCDTLALSSSQYKKILARHPDLQQTMHKSIEAASEKRLQARIHLETVLSSLVSNLRRTSHVTTSSSGSQAPAHRADGGGAGGTDSDGGGGGFSDGGGGGGVDRCRGSSGALLAFGDLESALSDEQPVSLGELDGAMDVIEGGASRATTAAVPVPRK
jgi:hypothetical protein